jgi:predicted RNA methylase
MGAVQVVGFDADIDALAIAQRNIEEADVGEIMDLVLCDVSRLPVRPTRLPKVDTGVSPPAHQLHPHVQYSYIS